MTYLLEAAPAKAAEFSAKAEGDATLVVFCVDVSGSMSLETDLGDGSLISRLRAAQAAVSNQLQNMTKETVNRRVALITFEKDVTFYGDGISLIHFNISNLLQILSDCHLFKNSFLLSI